MAAIKSIGELKFRVRFDKQTFDAAAPGGGALDKWREQFTRWAHIRPNTGSEQVRADRLTGIQPVIIVIRYDSETMQIDASWRAVEMRDGRPINYYALKTAEDMDRDRKYITLDGIKGDADA